MTRRRSWGVRPARIARTAVASLVLAASAFGFLFLGEAADPVSRAVASLQLFPAAERAVGFLLGTSGALGAAGVVAASAILLLSSVFGRWYCAALCPLGGLQDLATLLGRRKRGYRRPRHLLRAVAFLGFLCLTAAGAASLAAWIEPWSLFGRFFAYDLQPVVRLAVRADLPGRSAWIIAGSGAAMAVILVLAVFSGRWFCGSLCPVGSSLGILNRFAPWRLRLDPRGCVACGRCSAVCRASCIDGRETRLDATRCVYCLACLEVCPTGALHYGRGRRAGGPSRIDAPSPGRRRFLVALGAGGAALALSALPGRALAVRSLGPLLGRAAVTPVTPPGSGSFRRFLENCTACGLCVARCPSKVLQPSLGQLGIRGFLVPRLDYDVSYCQFDCTTCLQACPSGALEKLSLERKRLTKIGDADLIRERCIVITNRTKCGACAEHCTTGAVRMEVGATGLPEPVFSRSICIGCGACHHACPVRPQRAISVAGLAVHGIADRPAPDLFSAPDRQSSPSGIEVKKEEFPF